MHVIAGKAMCFKEALGDDFKAYQAQVVKNAKTLADSLVEEGFDIVSGGTDNHLMLVDVRKFSLTGKELERRLDDIGVTCNKNAIPFDPEKPFVTSGIRLGSPAVTTRGFKEEDMKIVAKIVKIAALGDETKYDEARAMVKALCDKYPLY